MEEDFINGVYHHLYYTLQMVWERVLKSLDSCADDVEDAQQKFQVRQQYDGTVSVSEVVVNLVAVLPRKLTVSGAN
jgi:hypothetical protein